MPEVLRVLPAPLHGTRLRRAVRGYGAAGAPSTFCTFSTAPPAPLHLLHLLHDYRRIVAFTSTDCFRSTLSTKSLDCATSTGFPFSR